ncbi:hypothetical protein ACFVVQ_12200 [Paenibacillus chitinolyticus]|uniref:hypothetical protein n=1 Tax=Paenibacillus chitinolyticus TaxID=79263 RepID=UPI0036DD179E
MPSYWGLDGKLVDMRVEVAKSNSDAAISGFSGTLPIAVNPNEHKSILTLTGLPTLGIKRITVGYRWDASISHQLYVNYEVKAGGGLIGNALTGVSTSQYGLKEASVMTDTIKIIANNQDAAVKNVTQLEVWLWYK